jgi:hypothetical protein
MNPTLLKALVAFLPTSLLFCGSMVLFFRGKSVSSLLQLVGAGGLVVVVLAHICEALHMFPSMRWGLGNSPGHYLDLSSAALAFILFPIGYLLHALKGQRSMIYAQP